MYFNKITVLFYLVCLTIWFSPLYGQNSEPSARSQILEKFLQDPKNRETLYNLRSDIRRTLDGGMFRAPTLYKQLSRVIKKFQNTDLVSDNSLFDIYFVSSSGISADVINQDKMKNPKLYSMRISRGLIDFITAYTTKHKIEHHSLGMLAAIVAHEIGHAMNGDFEEEERRKKQNTVHKEFAADEFSARLLDAAGIDPEATIHAFEMLEELSENDSLRDLARKILADHPKPSYRIAHVRSIVATLRSPLDLDSLDQSPENRYVYETLNRKGKEVTSKSSLIKFNKSIQTETYTQSDLRSRLRHIERYISYHTTWYNADQQTTVAIVRQFQWLLIHMVNNEEDINFFLASLSTFETSLNGIPTHKNKDKNVALSLKVLKKNVDQKQKEIFNIDEHLTSKTLGKWVSHLDKHVVVGGALRAINRAQSIDDIIALNNAYFSHRNQMTRRYHHYNKQQSQGLRDINFLFYEVATARVLHLTQNVEHTIDFVLKNFPPLTSESTSSDIMFNYIMSGIQNYVVRNPNVEWGNTVERLRNPKTAQEKRFAGLLINKHEKLALFFFDRRGYHPPSGNSGGVDYGLGRQQKSHTDVPDDFFWFLNKTLTSKGVSYVFNNLLVKRFYNIHEALDLLEQKDESSGQLWGKYRSLILQNCKKLNHRESQRELETQFDQIRNALAKISQSQIKLGDKKRLLDGLGKLDDEIKELISGNFNNLYRSYIESEYQDDDRQGLLEIDEYWLDYLSIEEKIDIFRREIEAEIHNFYRKNAREFLKLPDRIKGILKERVEAGKLAKEVFEEYIDALEKFSQILSQYHERKIEEFPADFFVLRRRLALMQHILRNTKQSYENNLTEKESELISHSFGLFFQTKSSLKDNTAIKKVHRLLALSKKNVLDYLKNTTGSTDRIEKSLKGMSQISEMLAHYNGVSIENTDSSMYPFLKRAHLALHFQHPEHDKKRDIQGGITLGQSLNLLHANPLDEMTSLFPLGPGFLRLFEQGNNGFENKTIMEEMFRNELDDFWYMTLNESCASEDPIDIVVQALSLQKLYYKGAKILDEEISRTIYVLLTKALRLISNEEQMQTFAGLLAAFLSDNTLGESADFDLLKTKAENLGDVTGLWYREYFFDELAQKLDEYSGWNGVPNNISGLISRFEAGLIRLMSISLSHHREYRSGLRKTLLHRIPILGSHVFPFIVKMKALKPFWEKVRKSLDRRYARNLYGRGTNTTPVDRGTFIRNVRPNTPWSEQFDLEIVRYIKSGDYFRFYWTKRKKRHEAVKLVESIRSLRLRSSTYKWINEQFGIFQLSSSAARIAKAERDLAYLKAKKIWGADVIEELRYAGSIFEAMRITENAWEKSVKHVAIAKGQDKDKSYELLKDLHDKNLKYESPIAGEISVIFSEGSRHRDEFLEQYVKSNELDFESLKMIESFKSRKQDTPYHKISKALFELLDEYTGKLSPIERSHVALYIGGLSDSLHPEIEEKISQTFYGRKKRRKITRSHGVFLDMPDIKRLFAESHEEEKLLAFRALFSGSEGISQHPNAENFLVEHLIFSDQNMPVFLQKVLHIYIRTLNSTERSILLSWVLANGDKGSLNGPQVLNLIVEKGGAVAAKMAQLIASHGFKLSEDYQIVLEKFKGSAQNVDKMMAFKWIHQRLPSIHVEKIKSLDRELGSGSIKIAYLATLKDGRRVVIKLSRDYAKRKIMREIQILREIVQAIQQDPETHTEGLEALAGEVERIILEEMEFLNELQHEKDHVQAQKDRPILIKWFGNGAKVYVPRPLDDWVGEGVLVEEYVEAEGWEDLADYSVMGWSKERLAKAAISEVLNQLFAYLDPDTEEDHGKVIVDIDPHEENQLAQTKRLGRNQMINIDLGQTVRVDKRVVRTLAQIISAIHKGHYDDATSLADPLMAFTSSDHRIEFLDELRVQGQLSSDPIEVFSKTIEELGIRGIILKSEYLFLQKLFATIVGMKRHIRDQNFIVKKVKSIVALRFLGNPLHVTKELGYLADPDRCSETFDQAQGL